MSDIKGMAGIERGSAKVREDIRKRDGDAAVLAFDKSIIAQRHLEDAAKELLEAHMRVLGESDVPSGMAATAAVEGMSLVFAHTCLIFAKERGLSRSSITALAVKSIAGNLQALAKLQEEEASDVPALLDGALVGFDRTKYTKED